MQIFLHELLNSIAVNQQTRLSPAAPTRDELLVVTVVTLTWVLPRLSKGAESSSYRFISFGRFFRGFLRQLLDLDYPLLLSLFQPFTSLFYHLVSQIKVGVVPLRINSSVEPLLGGNDCFIDAVQGAMRVRRQGWIVEFGHGVSSYSERHDSRVAPILRVLVPCPLIVRQRLLLRCCSDHHDAVRRV